MAVRVATSVMYLPGFRPGLSKSLRLPKGASELGFQGVINLQVIPTPSSAATTPCHGKAVARVALFDLSDASQHLVTDCFRQFDIQTVPLDADAASRLQSEKFEACVLPLDDSAGNIIELARSSPSNSRIVVFGLGGSARDSLRYSKLCINAVFHEPLERSAALKLVRSTRTLVMHEFRRYVRIPVMTEVGVVMAEGGRMTATSQEIS